MNERIAAPTAAAIAEALVQRAVRGVPGDNQINIVRMQCAIEKRGGNSMLIIGSDAAFPDTVLETIKSSKDILSVKVAALA